MAERVAVVLAAGVSSRMSRRGPLMRFFAAGNILRILRVRPLSFVVTVL